MLNIELPHDPAILLLCIYPRERKTHVHTKVCILIFTAAFTVAKKVVASHYPLTDEWINIM